MMKRMLRGTRAMAALAALLLLTGCASETAQVPPTQTPSASESERTFFAMDTVMTLRLYEGGDGAALDAAENRVKELEALWSVTDENSEIYALNRTGYAALSGDTAALLANALELCERTGGALDVTIYPVLRAWGFTTGEYAVPDSETIEELLARVGYAQVALDKTAGTAAIPDGVEIDLGSVAKGYTGDVLAGLLREHGVESAMLDLGGNIQTVGTKPDGSLWRIGVQDPEGDEILGVVEVVNRAAVTSGGYERYFERDGARYWHIMDPETGAPARSGLASVTVVGEAGVVCDALSTAMFVMGREDAIDFWRQYRDELGFELILVDDDGSVTITTGLEDSFTLVQTERGLTVARP